MANLEAPEPVTPDPTPPPVEAVAPEPVAPPADPLEAGAVDVQGGKYVPLAAVLAEREKAKQFKDKADAYDQTVHYVQSVRPYIDFLQANPDLMTRTTQQTAPSPVTTTQPVDDQAEELARTLDLYTADGQPDVKRAQKIRTMVKTEAQSEAEAQLRPLQDSSIRERAQHNYHRALVTKAPDGRTPDRQVLDALWSRTDPKVTSTEEGATAVVMLAMGMGAFTGQVAPPQPAASPALVTETPGSRQPGRPSLTALDEKIAGIRGRSADDWGKLTRTFSAGRPNVLEE